MLPVFYSIIKEKRAQDLNRKTGLTKAVSPENYYLPNRVRPALLSFCAVPVTAGDIH